MVTQQMLGLFRNSYLTIEELPWGTVLTIKDPTPENIHNRISVDLLELYSLFNKKPPITD